MNILLLGSGGRESALAWKLHQSPRCRHLYIAPGNPGTKAYGSNVPLSLNDFEGIRSFITEHEIHMLIPGPEQPLVDGIYDFLKADPLLKELIIAGPSKAGAQLEGSKAFSKKFMHRHNIPTAAYREFAQEDFAEGLDYLRSHSLPVVLKADGLAAGKGVIIAQTTEEAVHAFREMLLDGKFGAAGSKVVVEEFLSGTELSVFALTNGRQYVLLPEAKDYKRIGEGDRGLNTGGMGAVSPVPFADHSFMEKVEASVVIPTIKGLEAEGIDYHGFVFFGLINVQGNPFVIEYNCRMGDPETEVVMPRLENDLVTLLEQMALGTLDEAQVSHSANAAATVMMVAGGYPGDYAKGKSIMLSEAQPLRSLVFQAGTSEKDGELLTNGGRVIAVTGLGEGLRQALDKAYEGVDTVLFEGQYFRRDIGYEFL